jgi:hypothetical protein
MKKARRHNPSEPYNALSVYVFTYGSTALCWTLAAFSVS